MGLRDVIAVVGEVVIGIVIWVVVLKGGSLVLRVARLAWRCLKWDTDKANLVS